METFFNLHRKLHKNKRCTKEYRNNLREGFIELSKLKNQFSMPSSTNTGYQVENKLKLKIPVLENDYSSFSPTKPKSPRKTKTNI